MSSDPDAVGAPAAGGLAASVIEGREPANGGDRVCFNCGAKVEERFCGRCGQAAHLHRSLWHVFEEFIHGVLHFDTRAWRTLPMLAFRPGTLTRNYVHGHRARYFSPLAMFLFAVFLVFAVFSAPGEGDFDIRGASQLTTPELRQAVAEARTEEEAAQTGINSAQTTQEAFTVGVATQRAEAARRARVLFEAELARREGRAPADVVSDEEREAATGYWQQMLRDLAAREDFVVIEGWPALNESVRSKLENPDLALSKIREAASKFAFLLAPIALPFVALLFLWRRGLTLYDHLVFSLYSIAFAALLLVAESILDNWRWTALIGGLVLLLGMPVHMFFHLKGAYALGWFSAAWRTVLLLVFSLLVLLIFFLLIVLLGLAG